MQVVENNLLQVGLHLLHLSEDDTTFPLNLCLAQFGVLHDISQDLDGLGNVFGQAFGIVDSLFSAGIGVQLRPEILDFDLQLALGPLPGSLEKNNPLSQ